MERPKLEPVELGEIPIYQEVFLCGVKLIPLVLEEEFTELQVVEAHYCQYDRERNTAQSSWFCGTISLRPLSASGELTAMRSLGAGALRCADTTLGLPLDLANKIAISIGNAIEEQDAWDLLREKLAETEELVRRYNGSGTRP